MKTVFNRLMFFGSMIFSSSAYAHPGHEGHEGDQLVWDLKHFIEYPIATFVCAFILGVFVWKFKQFWHWSSKITNKIV